MNSIHNLGKQIVYYVLNQYEHMAAISHDTCADACHLHAMTGLSTNHRECDLDLLLPTYAGPNHAPAAQSCCRSNLCGQG